MQRFHLAGAMPIVLSAAGLLAGGCARGTMAKSEHLVLGVSLLRISLPVFVAEQNGLFVKHGLDVDLRRFDTAQPLGDELASGRLDAGGYVAFPILFENRQVSPNVRVVTAIVEDSSHPISYLLVRKGSGLHGTAALRGKKVGLLPTVAYRDWLTAVLEHDGVPLDTVTMMAIAPPLEVDALAAGGVDALFTGDPMATAALARGVAEPATNSPDVPRVLGEPFLFGTFAVTNDLVQRRPAVARALAASLDEAIALMEGDPSIGRQAIVPYLHDAERTFVDRYPNARYLRSDALTPEQLDRALELSRSSLRARDITMP